MRGGGRGLSGAAQLFGRDDADQRQHDRDERGSHSNGEEGGQGRLDAAYTASGINTDEAMRRAIEVVEHEGLKAKATAA